MDHDTELCPRCGSPEFRRLGYSTWTVSGALLGLSVMLSFVLGGPAFLLVFGVPVLLLRDRTRVCYTCGERWTRARER